MKTEDLIKLALLGGVAYFLYTFIQGLQKTAAFQGTASVIADFYLWATLPPAMTVQGNISLPSGDLIPLTMVDVRQKNGLTVASYQGHFYQLYPSDADGNWPVTLIQ